MYEKILEIYASIFAKPQFVRLNRFMFNLAIRGLGVQNYKNFSQSGEGKLLDVVFGLNKNRNLVFIDVGANKGDYIKLILDNNKDNSNQILAFEPGSEIFNYLQSRYDQQNIHLYNAACGEKTEVRYFYSDGNGGEFSSLYQSAITNSMKKNNRTKVRVVKLDDIISKHKLKKIHLLKIDTEGSEFEVLKGCQKAIAKKMVEIIQFEFNSMNVASRVFLKDFMTLLKGYSFYRLLPNGILRVDYNDPLYWEIFSFQNIIAVKHGIAKKFEGYYV